MDCSVKWVIIGYDVITSFLPETGPSALLRQTTTHIHEGRAMQTFRVTTRYGQPFDLNLRKQDARQLCHPRTSRLQLILMSFDTKFALSKFLFLFKNKQTKMSNLHNACCQRFSLIILKYFRFVNSAIALKLFFYGRKCLHTTPCRKMPLNGITSPQRVIIFDVECIHTRELIYMHVHMLHKRGHSCPTAMGTRSSASVVRPSVQVWTFLSPINPTDTMEEEHQSQGCS